MAIRALKLNRISFPPRKTTSRLEGQQAGKDVMVEEPTQPARIVTTDLKHIPLLMTSVTATFHSRYCGPDSVPYSWVICHFDCPPLSETLEYQTLARILLILTCGLTLCVWPVNGSRMNRAAASPPSATLSQLVRWHTSSRTSPSLPIAQNRPTDDRLSVVNVHCTHVYTIRL
jgi:hypothetical protein